MNARLPRRWRAGRGRGVVCLSTGPARMAGGRRGRAHRRPRDIEADERRVESDGAPGFDGALPSRFPFGVGARPIGTAPYPLAA